MQITKFKREKYERDALKAKKPELSRNERRRELGWDLHANAVLLEAERELSEVSDGIAALRARLCI